MTEPKSEEPKSPIDESIRALFRQGKYSDAVPMLREHLAGEPSDGPGWELLGDALRYSGDKPAAAAALSTAAEALTSAGHTLAALACQKKLDKLGVPPDFSSIRAKAPKASRVATPLFDELSDDEFAEVAEGLQARSFDPGVTIVEEGGPGDAMYVVVRGSAEVLVRGGSGAVKLAELRAGDFFGESALLSGRPRTATVKAGDGCECLVLGRDAYEEAVARHPRLLAVMEDFNRRRAEKTIEALVRRHRQP